MYTQWHITQPLKELIFVICNVNKTGNSYVRETNQIHKDKSYKFSLVCRNYKINLMEEPSEIMFSKDQEKGEHRMQQSENTKTQTRIILGFSNCALLRQIHTKKTILTNIRSFFFFFFYRTTLFTVWAESTHCHLTFIKKVRYRYLYQCFSMYVYLTIQTLLSIINKIQLRASKMAQRQSHLLPSLMT